MKVLSKVSIKITVLIQLGLRQHTAEIAYTTTQR